MNKPLVRTYLSGVENGVFAAITPCNTRDAEILPVQYVELTMRFLWQAAGPYQDWAAGIFAFWKEEYYQAIMML